MGVAPCCVSAVGGIGAVLAGCGRMLRERTTATQGRIAYGDDPSQYGELLPPER